MQIGLSLGRFGIKDECTDIIVGRFGATEEDIEKLKGMIKGTIVPLDNVKKVANVDAIKKLYKISDEELQVGSITGAILCRIAARDCS